MHIDLYVTLCFLSARPNGAAGRTYVVQIKRHNSLAIFMAVIICLNSLFNCIYEKISPCTVYLPFPVLKVICRGRHVAAATVAGNE